jgi:hypothetical protein
MKKNNPKALAKKKLTLRDLEAKRSPKGGNSSPKQP